MDAVRNGPHVRVAIVGSGFGGLGAAIRLREAGIEDFVLLERAHEIGGVWRDNVYPGCSCDVQSALYSFSFAPNPEWTRAYSSQWEIQEYLLAVAERYGLRRFVRFGHEVREAAWDEERGRWAIDTASGRLTSDVLLVAVGGFSEPAYPDLPGLDTFTGARMHSARWDPAFDPSGKRVGVVGTGASAVQIVPSLQPKVERLVVFQRTPAWVLPRRRRCSGCRARGSTQRASSRSCSSGTRR